MKPTDEYAFAGTRNARWVKRIRLLDANRQPRNLTGCTAAMQLRVAAGAPGAPAASATCTLDGDPTNGWITATISKPSMAALAGAEYRYDVVVTDAGGGVDVVLAGPFAVGDGVTT